jgi:hypothetical protein
MSRAGKWARGAVWGTVLAIFTLGCNPLSTLSFLTNPEPLKPAEYPLVFKEGPKKGKDPVTVALFVTSSSNIGPTFAGAEGRLAYGIAKELPEMAKEGDSHHKLVVLEPSAVNKFKMHNPNWKLMHPTEWGKKLNVDFVIDIQLEKMSLYQKQSANLVYEGQAEVDISVYDVDAGLEPRYNYVLAFKYPHTGVLDASFIPPERFKQDYLEHLATEICMKHAAHKTAIGIADGR